MHSTESKEKRKDNSEEIKPSATSQFQRKQLSMGELLTILGPKTKCSKSSTLRTSTWIAPISFIEENVILGILMNTRSNSYMLRTMLPTKRGVINRYKS
jgi:hypothetical protein